ncbi:MAG TPA: SMP-30/gluconolactonase/LRE family protein [Spirochaetota bacterium]|nr:SMP-30/gluconolactonase/LRE family protein [Spirochaetota bacterium]HNT09686.1 SMP-30/gluconolactonase/LRE family protein [Spirochaetota bacterium]
MTWKKILTWIVIMLVIAVIFTVKLLHQAGVFKTIEPMKNALYACSRVTDIPGPEDIVIDRAAGIAFISSDDRRAALRGKRVPGAVYRYRLTVEHAVPENITPALAFEFHPLGIDLYRSGETVRLFAVNIRADGKYIEIFDYRDGALTHVESLHSDLITSPNDIAAAGPRSFYVTNDCGLTSPLGRTIENYLKLPLGSVVHFDGVRFTTAARRLVYANGIALSRDGKRLFVASLLGRSLEVYDRDPAQGTLDHSASIDLGTCPDNISVDNMGALWIAAHPQVMKVMPHRDNPSLLSPSQVLTVSFGPDGGFRITDVYVDPGTGISASSVGAATDGRLLIGTIFDPMFLDCRARK